MLDSLGLVSEDGSVYISSDNPILDSFPTRLQDDGMGYGIDNQYFVSAGYSKGNLIFFTEPYNKEDVESLK